MPTVSYTTAGTYPFDVPAYLTMSVDVRGAGGGAATSTGANGTSGGYSSFGSTTTVQGDGGGGGSSATVSKYNFLTNQWQPGVEGYPGGAGGASGGDTNTTGGGAAGSTSGHGGLSYGTTPNGGAGGRAVKAFTPGASGSPTPGQQITVVVGAAGVNGDGGVNAGVGSVTITYTAVDVAGGFNMPMLGM